MKWPMVILLFDLNINLYEIFTPMNKLMSSSLNFRKLLWNISKIYSNSIGLLSMFNNYNKNDEVNTEVSEFI